ncbi:hypothetical protein ANCDUO_21573, partial [Ancylostoma duodenale]
MVSSHDSSDEDEGTRVRSVGAQRSEFPLSDVKEELGAILECLQNIPELLKREMEGHKVSARYKEKHNESVFNKIDGVCARVKELMERCRLTQVLQGDLCRTLEQRGIDSEQEWEQYIATVEKDGELVSHLCDILNTDVLLIVNVVKHVKQNADRIDDGGQERSRTYRGQSV